MKPVQRVNKAVFFFELLQMKEVVANSFDSDSLDNFLDTLDTPIGVCPSCPRESPDKTDTKSYCPTCPQYNSDNSTQFNLE